MGINRFEIQKMLLLDEINKTKKDLELSETEEDSLDLYVKYRQLISKLYELKTRT